MLNVNLSEQHITQEGERKGKNEFTIQNLGENELAN